MSAYGRGAAEKEGGCVGTAAAGGGEAAAMSDGGAVGGGSGGGVTGAGTGFGGAGGTAPVPGEGGLDGGGPELLLQDATANKPQRIRSIQRRDFMTTPPW
jgi:hypothetical protein